MLFKKEIMSASSPYHSGNGSEVLPLLVLNKIDMLTTEQRASLEQQLAHYRQIGYRVILVSNQTGEGLPELQQALQG